MMEEAQGWYGDMVYMLIMRLLNRRGDGSWLDGPVGKWIPKLKVVRVVIRYALTTGRLSTRLQDTYEANGDGS